MDTMFFKNKFLILLFVFLSLILCSNFTFAADVSLDITERGSVLNYYGVYYVVDVEGNITVTNENSFPIYTIHIPMTPGTLSFSGDSAGRYIENNGVRIPYLDPYESVTFSYRLFGVTTHNIIQHYSSGTSVFAHLLEDEMAHFRSDLWINLQKSEIGSIRGQPTRFIVVGITNPTPLEYQIKNIQVSRTDDNNVNNPNKIWTFEDKIKILGGDEWEREFQDFGDGMREDSVYWFIVDHDLANTFVDLYEDVLLNIYNEDYLDQVPSDDIIERPISERDKELFATTKVFLRKSIEPKRVFPGDIVNVTLTATNLDVVSKIVRIGDFVPDGFEIYEIHSKDSLIRQDELLWEVEINRGTSRIVSYSLRFIDENAVGLKYLPEAFATFAEGRVTSSRTPIIRQFVPTKKLYVQKNVKRLPGDSVEIIISIRNLGEASLSGLLLKDFLEDDDSFSEITQVPLSKGLWEIPTLSRNQEWQVRYKTNSNKNIGRLPQVFGIDESSVLKTIIMDNFVSHYIFSPSIKTLEIVGIAVLILFPILVIFMYKKKLMAKSGWDIEK